MFLRNKLLFRIWLSKLLQYLLIPTALCLVLLPLYDILHQQTIKAQLTDASEQLASSVSILDGYLYSVRFVTNKLFHEDAFVKLAASTDERILNDNQTPLTASHLLEELTYSMSPVSYSYVTFARNQIVIDGCRAYRSYDSFYPGTLEYPGMSRQEWADQLRHDTLTCIPNQKVPLYQTAYPDNYLSITQPYFDTYDRYMGSCTMLFREKQLIQLFVPLEQWQQECLFYIVRRDGTMLLRYRYDIDTALEDIPASGSGQYQGEQYLFVSRDIPDLDAMVVIGLPHTVYASSLNAINRVIWSYISIGLAASLILSLIMTVTDLHYLKPMMDTLDSYEGIVGRKYYDRIVQKLQSHSQLARELEQTRRQIEHARLDVLLKSGSVNSPAEQAQMTELLHLTQWNYLLLIPSVSGGEEQNEEFRLILLAEQVYQCFDGKPFIHNIPDGSALVVIPLPNDAQVSYAQLCARVEQLHSQLQLRQSLILSGCFTRLEQLSGAYWQVRNAAARPDAGQPVICLSQAVSVRTTMPEVASLERLNEYLLAGHTEKAQELVGQIFGSIDLSLQSFRQIFYSVRGVLLAAAEQVGCEDISLMCAYDQGMPMDRQVQRLYDCCLVIGSHVDALKQSHNLRLQQSILQWLEENYQKPELNLAMTAEQFQISKKYVSQFLKDQTGKSYNEYVEELRLTHAMQLLRETELSVTEIAVACGFSSQNTFYKAFRRRFDLSPSAVRNHIPMEHQ